MIQTSVAKKFAASCTTLIFVTVVCFLSGCIKTVQEQSGPLGTESNPADVQQAVNEAVKSITIANVKKNQSVTYEENYRVEMGPVVMSKRYDHKVLDILEDATTVTFQLFENMWTFFQSGAIRDEAHRELDLKFSKTDLAPGAGAPTLQLSAADISVKLKSGWDDMLHPHANTDQCTSETLDDGDGVKYNCIRYYNLVSEPRTVDAPEAMQNKDKCAGALRCQLKGTYIEYDQVKFYQGQMAKRVKLSAHFANDVPDLNYLRGSDGKYSYTPAVSSFCTVGLQKVDTSQYLVTLCSVLRDAQL